MERMSNADMLQYCEEALAWEDFGPIDVYFFQSVKNILLGKCSAIEQPEEIQDDLMGIERPVRDVELEPEYGKYADIYYGEEGDDDIPNYSLSDEDEAFSADIFESGFFVKADNVIGEGTAGENLEKHTDNETNGGFAVAAEGLSPAAGESFTVNI